jgi:hypothetical protein
MVLTCDLSLKQVYEEGQLVGTRLVATLSDVKNGAVMLT